MRVQPLGQEDPWRSAWEPTPVFLPGEAPWTEEPGRLQSIESHRVGNDSRDSAHMHVCYYRPGPSEHLEVRNKHPQKTIRICYSLGRTLLFTTITSVEHG